MKKEKRWHRDYWEEVHRFKGLKITRDRFTLDVLCCISILLLFFFYENLANYNLSNVVCRTFILSFFVQLIIHNCCYFLLYLDLYLWAKFTDVDPQFVCRKTIREERKIVSTYLAFLPSSYLENLHLCEILNGGAERGGVSVKKCRPIDIR